MREHDQTGRNRSLGRKAFLGLLAVLFVAFLATLAGAGSAAPTAAAAVPPANTALPAISGTALQGQTLTASSGSWSGTLPITFAYQWQRCDAAGGTCGNIAGATNQTYLLAAADVGGTLRAVVTATNGDGVAAATSAQSAVVGAPGVPSATVQPNPHGTYQVGQTITVDNGTWSGSTPITFTYQWQRCTASGGTCTNIAGATASSYVITSADVGSRLRASVRAANASGATSVPSNQSGIVTSTVGAPANTAKPTITNAASAALSVVLNGSVGGWTGNQPVTYTYGWNRCNAAGASCVAIAGATGLNYTVTNADVGARLQLSVKVSNTAGSQTATSALTGVISTGPAGAIALPGGKTSIPVTSVSLPERLVISEVKFSPSPVRSRAVITARFRVTDTKGRVVRDALVYAVGLPYNYVNGAPEVMTGSDGYAVIQLRPKAALPLRKGGALVVFVRARKLGDSVIAGVSTRRLVQVRLGAPG